jgi:hypothetical protein
MRSSSVDHLSHNDDAASTPYDALLATTDDVIAEWLALIRPEPWAHLPPSRLRDGLPEILPPLIRLARSGATHLDEELEVLISAEHGRARREDEVPISGVAEEWSALEHACWRVLVRHGFVGEEAHVLLQRLDVLIDDAIGYTLRGYYREELDSLKGRGLERRESGADRRAGVDDRRGGGEDRRGEPDGA